MFVLDINSDASTKFRTKTLKTMRRSALPVAVRSSLNSAAFDVKQNTMLKTAAATFQKRHNGEFFKANSRVDMATGFKISDMKSKVGFLAQNQGNTKLRGKHNYSVQDLEEQEYGGDISHKDFRALDSSRSGKNRAVRPKNRIELIKEQTNNFKSVIHAGQVNSPNAKQRFIRAAIVAKSRGSMDTDGNENDHAYIMGDTKRGKQILWRIDSIGSNTGTKKLFIKATPLYSYKKNNDWGVRGTGFMRKASMQSGKKLESYYIAAADKQIAKLKK